MKFGEVALVVESKLGCGVKKISNVCMFDLGRQFGLPFFLAALGLGALFLPRGLFSEALFFGLASFLGANSFFCCSLLCLGIACCGERQVARTARRG